VVEFLISANSWSSYASSLLRSLDQYGSLTQGQMDGVARMQASSAQRAAEREAAVAAAPVLTLEKINTLFANALGTGLLKPVLRVGALAISIAPATGRNAGALYVKDRGDYAGKITADGKFHAGRDTRAEVAAELQAIAADPLGRMVEHGRLTGCCSCCSRKLTNAESIALGIGPICREKWGL
jgi:hypothetical protein